MGVSGFPTIILRANEKLSLLSAGYQPFSEIKPKIDLWLEDKAETEIKYTPNEKSENKSI